MGESMSEFVARRRREESRLGRGAEATAHEAYGDAIRARRDLKLATPGDVMRHGARLLEEGELRAGKLADRTVRRTGEAVRATAIGLSGPVGNGVGVLGGIARAPLGLLQGAEFARRLASPLDPLLSPPGQSAKEQLRRVTLNAGRSAVDYVRKGAANPQTVVADLARTGRRWRQDLDPSATPVAPTFEQELRRNFEIGQNQGELAFNVGSVMVGGPAAKAIGGLGGVSNVGNAGKYVAQGFHPKVAAHLANPYPASAMGSHYIPRDYTLPPLLGGGPLPRWYSDGVFNRLAPAGISRGDMYELHFKVDRRFHGARLPAGLDIKGWGGKAAGLKKYGTAGRLWHGAPAPLKARVGGLGAGVGNLMHSSRDRENNQ